MYEESYALDPYAHNHAWGPVLEAIEQAMDVPGLPPGDRAQLAGLYELAQPFAGREVITTANLDRGRVAQQGTLQAARGPGGIFELRERLAPAHKGMIFPLVCAGYGTIDDIRAATDSQLLWVNRVGPVGLRALREAIESMEVER